MGLQIVLYCLVFCSAFLGLQAAIGAGKQIGVKLKLANYRLKQLEKEDTPAALIAKMRKDRSIGEDGKLKALNHKSANSYYNPAYVSGQTGFTLS